MTEQSLRSAADTFTNRLNKLVQSTLDTRGRFTFLVTDDGRRAIVRATDHRAREFEGLPLLRSNDDPDAPTLVLWTRFIVELDAEDAHLRVANSTFGLWVDTTGGRTDPRPLVRIEFDRRRIAGDHAAAHVHLHAHSPELAWLYGSSGQPAPDLHSLHFPVGGPRFRPTLEEFILFLDREGLYNDFKRGWKRVVLDSLREWEEIQASSTARRFPDAAADSLSRLGYTVIAPAA